MYRNISWRFKVKLQDRSKERMAKEQLLSFLNLKEILMISLNQIMEKTTFKSEKVEQAMSI